MFRISATKKQWQLRSSIINAALRVEQESLPAVNGNKMKLQMIAAPINPADFNVIQGTFLTCFVCYTFKLTVI